MMTSFAPLRSIEESPGSLTVDQMTSDAFDPGMLLTDCEPTRNDKFMACCLIYRGNVSALDANAAVDQVKKRRTINLVDWCPTGFKVGINHNAPGYIEDS